MFNFFKKQILVKLEFKCPYCFVILDKEPTRKQRCKFCKQEFLVRKNYTTGEKLVMTEVNAVKFDIEKKRYYIDKSLIDGLKLDMRVNPHEVDRLVVKARESLTKKFGQAPSLGDVAWSVANMLIIESAKKNVDVAGSIYFQMAMYLHSTDRDYSSLREKSFELDLLQYKKNGVLKNVEILATENSCESCKSQGGLIMSIEQALHDKPLPCNSCSYELNNIKKGWCRCCYAPSLS